MTDTTTRTKTKETIRHYPPREIVEDTKARRAWVEAKVAELKALPLRDAKSVQSGSYQHVVEYVLEEVAARVQIRGTCQFCGGVQAIEDGKIVLHGYERPGDGYAHGRCAGVRYEPAEISIDAAKIFVSTLRDQATADEQELEALTGEMRTGGELDYSGYPKVDTYRLATGARRSYGERKPRSEWTPAEVRAVRFMVLKRQIPALRDQATMLETHVIPKHGGELVRVLV